MHLTTVTARTDLICSNPSCQADIPKGVTFVLNTRKGELSYCAPNCAEGHQEIATEPYGFYRDYGANIGALVAGKQQQYGDAVGKTGAILAILYPNGIVPFQYTDVLMTVRVLDKLSRISQRDADGKDLGGETPWKDIAGYGLLGWRKDEEGSTG